jgi:hypothetical protein
LPRLIAKIKLLLHLPQNPNPNPNAQMAKMVAKTTFHPWLKFLPKLLVRKENHVISAIHLSHKLNLKTKLI